MNLGYRKVGSYFLAKMKYQIQEPYEILATWISGDEFSHFSMVYWYYLFSPPIQWQQQPQSNSSQQLQLCPSCLTCASLFTSGKKYPTTMQSFSLNHYLYFPWVTDFHDPVWMFPPSVHFLMSQAVTQNFMSIQKVVHTRQLDSKDVQIMGRQIPLPYKLSGKSIEVRDQSP